MKTSSNAKVTPALILLSHDTRLAQTRQWVLQQAGFQIFLAKSLSDLDAVAHHENVSVFLLCNSLQNEVRSEAADLIRVQWPAAKVLVFVPSYPLPAEVPADVFLPAMEGPRKLIQTIQCLIPGGSSTVH